MEIVALNIASKSVAHKRLPQGLSRSVSVFSGFMREKMDPVVQANQCAQYVDDIGIAANIATDFTRNIRAVSWFILETGFKLTIESTILESDKLNSQAKCFHPKESHQNLTKFEISSRS